MILVRFLFVDEAEMDKALDQIDLRSLNMANAVIFRNANDGQSILQIHTAITSDRS